MVVWAYGAADRPLAALYNHVKHQVIVVVANLLRLFGCTADVRGYKRCIL